MSSVWATRMRFSLTPLMRGFLGGFLGTAVACLVIYLGWIAYQDHKAIQVLIQVVTQQQQAAQESGS